MGKGANKQLLANAGVGQQQNKAINDEATATYGQLDPMLLESARNPQGYGNEDLASMRTGSEQSLGGSVSGISGEGNLQAARTRNRGGFQGALGEGARSAQRTLSQNAVGIAKANADLKQQESEQAIQQIMQLYGIDRATALNYLNSSNTALNSENQGSHLANLDFWNSFNNIGSKLVNGVAATPSSG